MDAHSKIRQELEALVKAGQALVAEVGTSKAVSIHFPYQAWYTRALGSLNTLAPDRIDEFRRYYEADPKRKKLGYGTYAIQDYLKGVVPNKYQEPDFDYQSSTQHLIYNQVTILASVASRIGSVLCNIEARLLAGLQDAELATARSLVKTSPRAAGALAGVVLEAHLQSAARAHKVAMSKKAPTLSYLNDALKGAEAYDIATWRKISFLADVRNLCAHKKDIDPRPEQVIELIDGSAWVIANVS